nr:serine phosphatase RsbU [uncultured bacterium]
MGGVALPSTMPGRLLGSFVILKRAYLMDEDGGRRTEVGAGIVIGRTRDCGFVIDDSGASRRHVEVVSRNGQFVWKDLGSTNGTLLNGARMLAGELKDGDRIQIGETVIVFGAEEAPAGSGAISTLAQSESHTFTAAIFDYSGQQQPIPDGGKASALLEAVYSVMNEIANTYEECPLMDRILEHTVRAIDAQRGAVFLAGADAELLPCPYCNQVHSIRDGVLRPMEPGEIRISSTIAQRVLKAGESVLYQDTDTGAGLNASESIMSLDLRSILCVPLRAKRGILGILYIDTDRQDQHYTHDDLLLASAVGNSAGLALHNAQMHTELLDKQRIEQEIETAWTIQEGFLVKDWPANDRRFQVYGETRPAKIVGGDFYDFLQPAPHLVGLLVGDVSGKGVPAALTMAQLLAQFRLTARDVASPAEVLHRLNKDLAERTRRGLFCTACYLTLDLETGSVICANAGHPPAMRVDASGTTLYASASGPPLGIVPEMTWTDAKLKVLPGDSLLLYSDGIIEARSMATVHGNLNDERYTEYKVEGLQRFVAGLHGRSPRMMLDMIFQDVQKFCAPGAPHDDCTLIALRYLGREN